MFDFETMPGGYDVWKCTDTTNAGAMVMYEAGTSRRLSDTELGAWLAARTGDEAEAARLRAHAIRYYGAPESIRGGFEASKWPAS